MIAPSRSLRKGMIIAINTQWEISKNKGICLTVMWLILRAVVMDSWKSEWFFPTDMNNSIDNVYSIAEAVVKTNTGLFSMETFVQGNRFDSPRSRSLIHPTMVTRKRQSQLLLSCLQKQLLSFQLGPKNMQVSTSTHTYGWSENVGCVSVCDAWFFVFFFHLYTSSRQSLTSF